MECINLVTYLLIFQASNCLVAAKYVKTLVKENIVYKRDHLEVQCIPQNVMQDDIIYAFSISKVVNGRDIIIVKMEADINNPPDYLKIAWYDDDMRSRGIASNSQLLPSSSARLVFTINASNVSCTDYGLFKCSISLSGSREDFSTASISVTVLDASVKVTDETKMKKSTYDLDDIVNLKCSASFSKPSCIRWCFKMSHETSFREYNKSNQVLYSEIMNDGCEYSRQSVLYYNVSKNDISTRIFCEICTTIPCMHQSWQDSIHIQNSNGNHVIAYISNKAILLNKERSINIQCLSKQLKSVEDIDRILLSTVRSESLTSLIELSFDRNTRNFLSKWQNTNLKNRAFLEIPRPGSPLMILLSIIIPAENVTCQDAAIYRCEMFLQNGKYSYHEETIKLITKETFVETIVSSPIALGINSVDVSCSTDFLYTEDTVSQIVLSKFKGKKLIAIELDLSSNRPYTHIRWYDEDLKSRGFLKIGKVYPANEAELSFQIPVENVTCSDAGKYICELHASNGKHGISKADVNISVGSERYHKVTEKTCKQSEGKYYIGHNTLLQCGGKVGNPPKRPHWCIKRGKDLFFSLFYDIDKVVFTEFIQNKCQFEGFSILQHAVSEIDTNTEFVCVSSSDGCKNASVFETYRIHRVKANSIDKVKDQKCYNNVRLTAKTECFIWQISLGGLSFLGLILVLIRLICCRTNEWITV